MKKKQQKVQCNTLTARADVESWGEIGPWGNLELTSVPQPCTPSTPCTAPQFCESLTTGPHAILLFCWGPLNVSRTPEIPPKWSLQLPLIDLSPFPGSLTHLGASRRLRGQKYIKARPILGHILTFFDPPCQPGQIFLVQNSLYRCPTYSTTCFMLNSHLLGVF